MRVPGFGSSANSFNSFIIIALLDHWKNRNQDSQTVMRQAIGKIVTVPQAVAFSISPSQLEFQAIISQFKWSYTELLMRNLKKSKQK